MSNELDVKQVFNNAQSCGDHPLQFDLSVLDGATTLVALGGCGCGGLTPTYETCESFCDSGSFALAQLTDGRFMVVEEASDSSGHGCQCGGSASVHPTLDEALSALSTEYREVALTHLAEARP